MITVFYRSDNSVLSAVVPAIDPLPKDALWIDICNPTAEEEKSVEAQLNIEIPTREEIWQNQVLNRFYQENGIRYMTAAIITKVDSPHPQTSAITFIVAPTYLLTIRYISPTSFQYFSQRLLRSPQKFPTGSHVMEGLLEEIITRVAYNSEIVVNALDSLSHDIFSMDALDAHRKNPSQMMKDILKRLGSSADLNSKINESLHSLNRLINYFKQQQGHPADVVADIEVLVTDVVALIKQTQFLSDKITFQLDATLGMINVEQNLIIKIFSVVAVFFLPPTMVSSIYGMNFHHMPELDWLMGYPMALTIMLICALIPFIYFRKKGWL